MMSNKESQNIAFWQERLRKATEPIYAIGVGFDWPAIDDVHKKIFYQHYKPGMKILDIGCGIGRTADWVPKEEYVGFDFVPEFVEMAQKSHPDRKFLVLDVKDGLPFKDKEFDIAIGISFKHIFITGSDEAQWEKVRLELLRVTKKLILLPYGNNDPAEIHSWTEIYE